MLLQAPIDWASVAKTWGPLGLMSVLFLLLVWQGAKVAKKFLEDTVADARSERDVSRQLAKEQAAESRQMLKQQADEFTAHIKQENEAFRRSLKEVVDTFEHAGRRK